MRVRSLLFSATHISKHLFSGRKYAKAGCSNLAKKLLSMSPYAQLATTKTFHLPMDMACCCKDYDFSCLGSKLEQDWDLVEYYQRSCVFNACCWSNDNDMSTDIVYVKSTVSCKR